MSASLQLAAYEVEQSVDIQQNTSRLYVRLEIHTANGTYNRTGDTVGAIHINGQTISLDGKDVELNTVTVLYEDIHTIVHTADGTKSVTVAAEFDPNTPATDRMHLSQTLTLTPIPRASALAATDANIGSVSMVAVSRFSPRYSHSILWQFGELAGWLDGRGGLSDDPVWLTETSLAFPLPESFYTQIPNAPWGECRLTCFTALEGVQIGDPQSVTIRAVADPELCAPAVEFSVEDVNPATVALTGDSAKMVRYASTARCSFRATGRNGAVITAREVENMPIDADVVDIPNFALNGVRYSAVDSRGYYSGGRLGLDVVDYVPLTIHLSAGRTDPTSGAAQVTLRGNCFRGSFGAADNTLHILCRVGEQSRELTAVFNGNTYEATGLFEELDYRRSYPVSVSVTDALASVTATAEIGKGVPVFHWGEEDFTFCVPVNVPAPQTDSQAVNRGYALAKAGDAMTGTLAVPQLQVKAEDFPQVQLCDTQGVALGSLGASRQHGSVYLSNHRGDAYESYLTPPFTGAQTGSYYLLTTKSAVTVEQGGTGAADAAAARANLGIGCRILTTAALEENGVVQTLAAGFSAYLVVGYPRPGSGIMTSLIPASMLTVDPVKYQIADDSDYCAFEMWVGDTPGIRKTGGAGAILAVFGIN